MFVYGAGGHAKVILEILEARGIAVTGLFDDREDMKDLLGYPVRKYVPGTEINKLLLAIGNNSIRKRLAEQISADYAVALHPSAIISKRSSIGAGTVVMAGAVVNTNAEVGRHCIININASVDHDCQLGDFVHVAPGACLCGGVTVGEGAWIGAGAVVKPGVRIGSWVEVAPGTAVLEDLG